ncbi:lipase [Vibrio cyclitrophicus 1F53]|uniref:Lipase n=2 Tax=Vibrio cyclitrophicus TaxID=47951 RepID=A0A7Z1MM98_9VIBR|nr:lipase [Vibrio cyclitrophicus]ERM57785.1 Lipase-like protein [Vibrio cyclitrophicus FF75]OED95059.1 lipase [Vibrio cyclitrophicus ZF28]OEE48754.1 lipase [Vibrio cyclitrophicus FF75]OEE81646.1 lipase [Vibrio cyclitrophicus FF160]OEF34602.1 lipase [Vibrio cyclitrophicus 1F53]
MTTPVKCESYEGAVLKDFNKPYICGLITLALLGCQSEDSAQDAVLILVPYNINELPKPNDGYGYDEDGTISGVGEDVVVMSSTNDAYYQDYNNSYAALDGWGLCAEPILIPLKSVNSDKRYPLNNETLAGNVVLIDEITGDEVDTQISADGSNIIIQCESGLKEGTTYSIVVTDGVKTEFNEPLKADASFDELIYSDVPLNNEKEEVLQDQVLSAIESYYALYPEKGIPVYAAQFKTQSSYSSLDAMKRNHLQYGSSFTQEEPVIVEEKRGYNLYTKVLKIPSYLPFTKEREAECIVDEFDPKENCPPLYEWITNTSGSFPTAENPMPQKTEDLEMTADIYVPKEFNWNSFIELPVAIFIHGVTAERGTASLMAAEYTDKGYAVVAIDMPYHGERIRYDSSPEHVEISARANKAFFINIDSPLALRSNLQQSVSDFLGLRYALSQEGWVDNNNVHLIGQSLGGIMSVMVSEFSQASRALTANSDFTFNTVNFVVPGQGLTNLVLSSQTLGPEMSEGVKKSPDVQRGIAETVIPDTCTTEATNQQCIEALRDFVALSTDNALLVSQLEDDIFDLVVTDLKQGVQATIDSADPASFISRQVAAEQPTLLLAAVGDCGDTCDVGVDYVPDSVIPNTAPGNIRTGTEPLITALGLDPITGTSENINEKRGAVRTTTGGHGTYLFPYEGPADENGLPGTPGENMSDVREAVDTQQIAVASMVMSDGAVVVINNEDHIETEVPQDEE